MTSYWDTADMLAYYPEKVKKWLDRRGGLTPDIKTMKSGPELWAIIHPCPKERARRTAKVTQDERPPAATSWRLPALHHRHAQLNLNRE